MSRRGSVVEFGVEKMLAALNALNEIQNESENETFKQQAAAQQHHHEQNGKYYNTVFDDLKSG